MDTQYIAITKIIMTDVNPDERRKVIASYFKILSLTNYFTVLRKTKDSYSKNS
jgi:hypothetical protein